MSSESCTERPALLTNGHVLETFLQDIKATGLAGRKREALLLYLSLTSRYCDKPVSVVLKGQSSSGKSFLVGRVLKFFPSDAYIEFSSMSSKALVFSATDVSNKFLVIAEATGLSEDAMYLIRTLQSEGRVVHETSIQGKDGKWGVQRVEKEGPTGLIVTTTKAHLFHDNETRSISIELDDSREVVEAGLDALVSGNHMSSADFGKWHEMQANLRPHAASGVVIPFGRALVQVIKARQGPLPTRVQRDLAKVLSLIEASALVHEAERGRDSAGRIIATLDDYELVRWILGPALDEGIGGAVPTQVVQVVDAVSKLGTGIGAVVRQADVGELLGWDKSTVSRWVKVALADGYLRNTEPNARYNGYRLVVGNPLPQNRAGGLLPTRQEIEASEEARAA